MAKMIDIDASVNRQKKLKIGGKIYIVIEPSIRMTAEHNKRMFETMELGLEKAEEVKDKMIESVTAGIPDLPKEVADELPSSAIQRIVSEIYDLERWKDDDSKNSKAPGEEKA